jgi:uncharacterized membrane protein YvbJ
VAYCRNCGHDTGSGARFCPNCGQDQSISGPQDERIQTDQIPVPAPPRMTRSAWSSVGGFVKNVLGVVAIGFFVLVLLTLLFGGG